MQRLRARRVSSVVLAATFVAVGFLGVSTPAAVTAATTATATPQTGTVNGGNVVAVQPSSGIFEQVDEVTIDSEITSYWISSGVVWITMLPHPAGTVTITVKGTTSSNATATLMTASYTYGEPPVMSSVSPSSGTTAGGNTITITGEFFSNAQEVTFDGEPATFTVVSSTVISVVTPAHAAGDVTVMVGNPCGTYSLEEAYEYGSAPVVSVVSDKALGKARPTANGVTVTVKGRHLGSVHHVRIDGLYREFTDVHERRFSVRLPGPLDTSAELAVFTKFGMHSASGGLDDVSAPVFRSITPSEIVKSAHARRIIIKGSHLRDIEAVRIGGKMARSIEVLSGSRISVRAPKLRVGEYHVFVETSEGSTRAKRVFRVVQK